ncbi:hypothetical protein D1831_11965 [Lactiplantibacillus garii]|uniref:Mor transcription activator domain-containing protein n=1 Tax=Lactiplantibacillus garii TaxID=2306423 RepID=A0A3R8LIP1_9LACO|nr:Mor transcription activator family protein [Lactiplantibacillus garii]RRK09585.1 hypothetical protein D1831_11965 [Lactiplantibacillus garii]
MANQIDVDALHPFYQGIHELVGSDAMLKIFNAYRGMQLTIPTHLYDRQKAAQRVLARYDGHNAQDLAREYGYSQRWVIKVVRTAQKNQ